jgi:hypothetical protein
MTRSRSIKLSALMCAAALLVEVCSHAYAGDASPAPPSAGYALQCTITMTGWRKKDGKIELPTSTNDWIYEFLPDNKITSQLKPPKDNPELRTSPAIMNVEVSSTSYILMPEKLSTSTLRFESSIDRQTGVMAGESVDPEYIVKWSGTCHPVTIPSPKL